MRPRFIAAVGPSDPAARDAIARRLDPVFPVAQVFGDMTIYLETSTPHLLLPHAGGAVIGTVIDRSTGKRLTAMPSPSDRAVQSSEGRHLLDSCFGAYVALWTRHDGNVAILRDPSAALPVYVARTARLTYIFSDIGMAAGLGLIPIGVDWGMLAHSLLFEQLMTRATAIAGIEEVLPGERMDCAASLSTELMWRPWSFAHNSGASEDPAGDARIIADAVDEAVHGWANAVGKVNVELSGGLDSSIIAASLATSRASWTCSTIDTGGDDGDERHYSRIAAQYLGAELIEIDAAGLALDPMAPLKHLTPKPRAMRILAAIDQCFSAAATAAGADAIFNGIGGDNVFAFTRSTAPIVDAWNAKGMRFAQTIARDLATLTRTPLASVYGALARRILVAPVGRRWPADNSFLASSVRTAPRPHPWMRAPRGTAQGVRAHIGGIIRIHGYTDCLDRSADNNMIYPLLSQPVMEACLSVPSWRWVEGGHNRALARRAFAGRLPNDILLRRSKGRADSLVVAAVEKARGQIRELILDGMIAKAGLLDRPQLEKGLAAPFTERTSHHSRLLQLADAELWTRNVDGLRQSVPLRP